MKRRSSVPPPKRREFPIGACVVRGRPLMVEEVIAYKGNTVQLRALYFGKKFANDITIELPMVARAATPRDHENAKRYAARFEDKEDNASEG